MKKFSSFLLTLFIACSSSSQTDVAVQSIEESTTTSVVEDSNEKIVEENLNQLNKNPYLYENHSENYICISECLDNNTEIFAGNVKGTLLIKLENQIISDVDYLSANEMLLTMHDTGKILLLDILNNSITEWLDLSSIVLIPGTQESGLQNIEIDNSLETLFVSYTSKTNSAVISKFSINNTVPDINSETILVSEKHMGTAHYCGTLALDESNNRLFSCLGDAQLQQLSVTNWNIHGSIFSIDINTGKYHSLNPKPNLNEEFSKDAIFNRGGYEADKRIVASGFRNPWNFTIHESGKYLVVPDVGWLDYEELNTIHLDEKIAGFYGWPYVEGPFFRQHYGRILTEGNLPPFFTSEQEIAKEIAFTESVPPRIYYYHEGSGNSIIGGQFITVGDSMWFDYYVFTDMFDIGGRNYFSLLKFDEYNLSIDNRLFLENQIFKNSTTSFSPIISIENDYEGNILSIHADGSIYKLIFNLD